ncbi:MAG: ribokinase [Methylophilaceae bacterium]
MSIFVIGSFMHANFMEMERLPAAGESVVATSMRAELGGKGLNLAVGMHRLGARVSLFLAAGHDAAGNAMLDRLKVEGVCASHVLRLGEYSGYGVGFIGHNGANVIAVFPGANALLSAAHVEQESAAIASASWICSQYEVPEDATLQAFKIAKQHGVKTYLNPSPWRKSEGEWLGLTDVLVVNESEAAAMFDLVGTEQMTPQLWCSRLSSLARTLGWKGYLLVVTLAEFGCVALEQSGNIIFQPAWPIRQIDATGAGDAFGCGLLWSLINGLSVPEALINANACGALLAASAGCLDALPTCQQLLAFKEKTQF